jgi:hypothetical protein
MSAVLTLKFIIDGKPLLLQFIPLDFNDYNLVISCGKGKVHLNVGFEAMSSIFLMLDTVWAGAFNALNSERYILGKNLKNTPGRPAKQMFLTWFGFPKTREQLNKFSFTSWQKEIAESCVHHAQENSRVCIRCGIYFERDCISSDEEDESDEDLCICGKEIEECVCPKCKICGEKDADCICEVCDRCDKCKCSAKDLHRKLHVGKSCTCEFCPDCDCLECECEESSSGLLVY